MLNRIEWDRSKVQADVFSLEGLIAWLEKQPAEKVYCYQDRGGCLFYQYFTTMGLNVVTVRGVDFDHRVNGTLTHTSLPDCFIFISLIQPHTFGAALDRARKLASSPVQP